MPTCPICRRELDCPERYLGKNWRCPACRTDVLVREDGTVTRWEEHPQDGPRPEPVLSGTGRGRPDAPLVICLAATLAAWGGLFGPLWPFTVGSELLASLSGPALAIGLLSVGALLFRFLGGGRETAVLLLIVGAAHLALGAVDFSRSFAEFVPGGAWGRLALVLAGGLYAGVGLIEVRHPDGKQTV